MPLAGVAGMGANEREEFLREQMLSNLPAIRGVLLIAACFSLLRGALDYTHGLTPDTLVLREILGRFLVTALLLAIIAAMRPGWHRGVQESLMVAGMVVVASGVCWITAILPEFRAGYSLIPLTMIYLIVPSLFVRARTISLALGLGLVPIVGLALVLPLRDARMYAAFIMLAFALGMVIRAGWIQAAANSYLLRQQLLKQAMRDPLTHALNRGGWESSIEANFPRGLPSGSCVMFLDLDNFKAVNDLHGHAEGDALICATAHHIQRHLGAQDLFARFGGDEFIVLLPGANLRQAQDMAEHIRRDMAAHGRAVNGTVSVGLAQKKDGEALEDLIERADQTLLDAKGNGKNRVVLAS
jgi:diguanylate cyclase (GGDEF)-like protein